MTMSDDMFDMDLVRQIADLAEPAILFFLQSNGEKKFSDICEAAEKRVENYLSSASKYNRGSYVKGIRLAIERLVHKRKIWQVNEPTYKPW